MRYSLRSSFSRYVFVLFFAVLALTIAGRIVSLTGAEAFCKGWPYCVPTAPEGWMKLAHMSLVGIASILMLIVFRKAWREQREQRIVLPLTTILPEPEARRTRATAVLRRPVATNSVTFDAAMSGNV